MNNVMLFVAFGQFSFWFSFHLLILFKHIFDCNVLSNEWKVRHISSLFYLFTNSFIYLPKDSIYFQDQRNVLTAAVFALGAAEEALTDANWKPETEKDCERTV